MNKCGSFNQEEIVDKTRGIKLSSRYNLISDSKVIDDVHITIVKHEFINKKINDIDSIKYLSIQFKNTSEFNISKVLFNVLFYDAEHNLLDTVEQEFCGFVMSETRIINIETSRAITSQICNYEILIKSITTSPKSIATGNDMVEIIKHNLLIGADPYDSASVSGLIELSIGAVSLSIRNITDKVLSTIIFNVELYDINNNLIDTIRHNEYELKPLTSRSIMVSSHKYKGNHATSYKLHIIKTLTTETEKIQLRKHDRITLDGGGERITGLLKNISENKTDTAVIVTFLDSNNEKINTKVLPIKDIDAYSMRRFSFDFYPTCGEIVKGTTVEVGSIHNIMQ